MLTSIRDFLVTAIGKPEPSDLAENLNEMFKDIFSCWLEDEGEYLGIARVICETYGALSRGDISQTANLVASAKQTNIFTPEMAARLAQMRAAMPDSDEDDDGDSMISYGENMEEDEPEPQQEAPKKREPVIDEDGFQMVLRSGRKRQ